MKKQQTEGKKFSRCKKSYRHYGILIILAASIIAEALPYSVPYYALYQGAGYVVVQTDSYFSFRPLLHCNVFPFISAIATVVSLILLCYDFFHETVRKRRVSIWIFMAVAVVSSIINCIISISCLSGIITCLLFAALFIYLSLVRVNGKLRSELLAFLVLVIGVSTISFQAEACSLNGDIDNDVDQEVYAMTSDIEIEEELKDAHQGIIDSDVSEEVLNGIVVESSDGSDVSYTVKHLGKLSRDSESDGDVYTLTAVSSTKTSSGNITEDNVYCWISLTWIDNRGTSNEIVSVSGGWNPNGRTLSDRQVWYGVSGLNGAFIDDLYEDHALDSDTYAYTPSKKLVGFQLRAYSWVSSAGYNKRINCSVTSSIFD